MAREEFIRLATVTGYAIELTEIDKDSASEPPAKRARTDGDSQGDFKVGDDVFYEYDLALPARQCVAELATACLPEKVILLSSCIRDGTLHVLRVDADPAQWKRAGKALQDLRSSFTVAATPEPEAKPEADAAA